MLNKIPTFACNFIVRKMTFFIHTFSMILISTSVSDLSLR